MELLHHGFFVSHPLPAGDYFNTHTTVTDQWTCS